MSVVIEYEQAFLTPVYPFNLEQLTTRTLLSYRFQVIDSHFINPIPSFYPPLIDNHMTNYRGLYTISLYRIPFHSANR